MPPDCGRDGPCATAAVPCLGWGGAGQEGWEGGAYAGPVTASRRNRRSKHLPDQADLVGGICPAGNVIRRAPARPPTYVAGLHVGWSAVAGPKPGACRVTRPQIRASPGAGKTWPAVAGYKRPPVQELPDVSVVHRRVCRNPRALPACAPPPTLPPPPVKPPPTPPPPPPPSPRRTLRCTRMPATPSENQA